MLIASLWKSNFILLGSFLNADSRCCGHVQFLRFQAPVPRGSFFLIAVHDKEPVFQFFSYGVAERVIKALQFFVKFPMLHGIFPFPAARAGGRIVMPPSLAAALCLLAPGFFAGFEELHHLAVENHLAGLLIPIGIVHAAGPQIKKSA